MSRPMYIYRLEILEYSDSTWLPFTDYGECSYRECYRLRRHYARIHADSEAEAKFLYRFSTRVTRIAS